MGRRSAYAVSSVALLAAVALVGGCTSTPEPTPTTSSPAVTTSAPSSTTPSPTASSPSPSASVIPAAAKVRSEAGAIAFVKFFIERSSQAWQEADPEVLTPFVSSTCKSCEFLVDRATKLRTEGHHYAGDVVTVTRATVLGSKNPTKMLVDTTIAQHAVSIVDASGRVVDSDQAKTLTRLIELTWGDGRWSVSGIG